MPLPYRWQWRVDRWKNALRSMFGGGESQPRPKLCPACGALVGITATRCHECGTSLRFSLPALSKYFSGIIGGPTPVTTALLVVNILVFGIEVVRTLAAGGGTGLSLLWRMDTAELYHLGSSIPLVFFHSYDWYRLATAMFLHGGLIHIGFNMMSLMEFGPALEELYGSPRFLFLYVVTGVCGFLASAATVHLSVGASTALLGLIGAIIAITTKRGGAYMRELRSRLITSVIILFIIGWQLGVIDNWGHGGGFVAGFILGKIFVDRQPLNSQERTRAHALGWFAGAVLLASFVFMMLHFQDPLPRWLAGP